MGINGTPKRKIRVLQLIDTFDVGGAEKIVLSLATKIRNDRFEVIPCALFGSGPLEEEMKTAGIPYRVLGLPRRSILTGPVFLNDLRRLVAAIRRILGELSIDILHTHLTHSTLVGTLAARQNNGPLICATVHNIVLHERRGRLNPRAWLMRAGVKATFSRADRIIAVSEKVSEAVHLYANIPSERIITIANGIDPDRFQCQESRSVLRQKLNFPMERPVLISVGRLTCQKGYPHLLGGLALLPSEERPFAVIVGDGPDRKDLELKARVLKLNHDVQFLGNRRDIPALLAAADLFVLPSLWEGLPLALLEAMASRLPSVVTAVGENPNVIEDGKSGIVVPPGDESALAGAVLRLLRDPLQRKRIGQAARERFEIRFSLPRFIDAHESLYEQVLSERLNYYSQSTARQHPVPW